MYIFPKYVYIIKFYTQHQSAFSTLKSAYFTPPLVSIKPLVFQRFLNIQPILLPFKNS